MEVLIHSLSVRERVLARARALLGAAFVHRGRTATGTDCAGVVVMPLQAEGVEVSDREVYARSSSGRQMPEALAEFADRIELENAKPGDLLTFYRTGEGREEHVAWLDYGGRIIHADGGEKRVVSCILAGKWKRRLVAAWRVRGLR